MHSYGGPTDNAGLHDDRIALDRNTKHIMIQMSRSLRALIPHHRTVCATSLPTAMRLTLNFFSDSPEYTERSVPAPILFFRTVEADSCPTSFFIFPDDPRLRTPFAPPRVSLKEIHDAVPKHLMRKNPLLSTAYILRDISLCVVLGYYAWHIQSLSQFLCEKYLPLSVEPVLRTLMWVNYWWWQGLVFTGFFCIGGNV